MARRANNVDPCVQLRRELALLKQEAVPFEEAWERAHDRINWPHDKQARIEWQAALIGVKTVWADCYLDRGVALEIERIVGQIAATE
jgi:hypothetical protein